VRILVVRLLVGLTVLAGTAARADQIMDSPDVEPDPDRGVFWRDVTEPHKAELRMILDKARTALTSADQSLPYEGADEWSTRVYREVHGMLRYARRLAPTDTDVLQLLGRTADRLGKTHEAIEALQMAVSITGPDRASPEVTGRLGSIYLRLGELDIAIRYLRLAQGPIVAGMPNTATVSVDLATALALRGQMPEAIDVLSASTPMALAGYYPNEMLLAAFALAVMYDRDEQTGAAFEVIDHMMNVMQTPQMTTSSIQGAFANHRFSRPEDEHYYSALAFEVGGYFPEARLEWALYAADPHAPWRGRALAHLADLDRRRR
jgi:hypothetical protein